MAFRGFTLLIVGLVVLAPEHALAQCDTPAARVISIDRQVTYKAALNSAFTPARLNQNVCHGDAISTGERSRATIAFVDNIQLVIDQNTTWIVRPSQDPSRTLIELIKGAILFLSRQPRSLDVETPFVNAAVEGTEFLVRVEETQAVVTVFEGRVTASNPGGSLALTPGQSAVVEQGQAPRLEVLARPRDAVQWALRYQPVLAADSFEQLDAIPGPTRSARFFVRRAGLLLGVGRVEEARGDISQALAMDPNNSDAYALLTIIAVTMNDKEEALQNGRRAVEHGPTSVAARIALSYALQAGFDLDAALDELLQAVTDQPNDASAWARLAELWLSLGYLDRAQLAAARASALSPDLARANAVLGFATLVRFDTSSAKAAFERALAVQPDSPLARLGLGLAKIREGDLEEGRRELEVAAMLNPSDPIIRSYLGKAYAEENREPLPSAQFDLAKELDPADPTPWFYDAIRKQSLNRPVEALSDLRRSMVLNDNRAVYRSSLLLDSDSAARSASLGRIYQDLGFEQRALVHGWNSVDADPSDHSGHRLLADVYSALPGHEVARVSELLQAQLLQPRNVRPVPPSLAEIDLAILPGSGPTHPAFNEFNQLFNRDNLAFQGSVNLGAEGVAGDEVVLSGVFDRVSFSAGQFHYQTDGFRENAGQTRDLYNAFAQVSLSPSTSVQGEVRSSELDRGDILLRFDPESFSPARRQREDLDSARVGAHHAFTPRSDLIASVMYGRSLSTGSDRPVLPPFFLPGRVDGSLSQRGWLGEVQHLYRGDRVRLITGAGHFQTTRNEEVNLATGLPFPPFMLPVASTVSDTDSRSTKAYAYANIDGTPKTTLTLGASIDALEDGSERSTSQFNPKVGITWNPAVTTTVRAAVFRTLQRSLVLFAPTIEPTQIAGFNQFLFGVDGERAWRYGVAIDQSLPRDVFAGIEYSWRDLDVPATLSGVGVVRNDWKSELARAYLYVTPHRSLAVTAEYLYEQYERDGTFGDLEFKELRYHRLPVGLAYFHPSGLRAKLKSTHVRQDGSFVSTETVEQGQTDFTVVDASVGYRLPNRYGLVTLEAQNLLNRDFRFQETDPRQPRHRPGRLVFVRFTLTN